MLSPSQWSAPSQQERTRAAELFAQVAEALVRREAIELGREVQEVGHVAVERVHTVRDHRIRQEGDSRPREMKTDRCWKQTEVCRSG